MNTDIPLVMSRWEPEPSQVSGMVLRKECIEHEKLKSVRKVVQEYHEDSKFVKERGLTIPSDQSTSIGARAVKHLGDDVSRARP